MSTAYNERSIWDIFIRNIIDVAKPIKLLFERVFWLFHFKHAHILCSPSWCESETVLNALRISQAYGISEFHFLEITYCYEQRQKSEWYINVSRRWFLNNRGEDLLTFYHRISAHLAFLLIFFPHGTYYICIRPNIGLFKRCWIWVSFLPRVGH